MYLYTIRFFLCEYPFSSKRLEQIYGLAGAHVIFPQRPSSAKVRTRCATLTGTGRFWW